MNLDELVAEVKGYVKDINIHEDGIRLYTNYQKVTAYSTRLLEIRNEIALLEIKGNAPGELKKFRTMILDPTIDHFNKVAAFESRKITARKIEMDMER